MIKVEINHWRCHQVHRIPLSTVQYVHKSHSSQQRIIKRSNLTTRHHSVIIERYNCIISVVLLTGIGAAALVVVVIVIVIGVVYVNKQR